MTIERFLEIADELLTEEADDLLQEELNHKGTDYTEAWKEHHHRRKYLDELIWLAREMKR